MPAALGSEHQPPVSAWILSGSKDWPRLPLPHT